VRTVAIVGCGKAKREGGPYRARELYTSQLFLAALDHAERTAMRVFILSAKYGILETGSLVMSYDQTLADRGPRGIEPWADRCLMSVVEQLHPSPDAPITVAIYAGAAYARPLRDKLVGWNLAAPHREGSITVEEPLAGMQIGQRLHWLKERRA